MSVQLLVADLHGLANCLKNADGFTIYVVKYVILISIRINVYESRCMYQISDYQTCFGLNAILEKRGHAQHARCVGVEYSYTASSLYCGIIKE